MKAFSDFSISPRLLLSLVALAVSACDGGTGTNSEPGRPANETSARTSEPPIVRAVAEPVAHSLVPLPGKEREAPAITRATRVVLETTAGNVVIEVYPEAAPNAAERFVELVASGFYNGTPISRVVPGFVAQFGINWREPHRQWRDRPFPDDPSLFSLAPGTLAFAKAGPGTATTQVFINTAQNDRLALPQYGSFSVFGMVVEGMDVVERFVRTGDPSMGLDQMRLWTDGEAYLASLETKPTMIERAYVL
ncbi:MAG: peptidylprolyl isomerase [Gammaproteobacteria bacterium]|nr:hypothetical protein [Gammaproteobacteria bacterium]